jgi:hypothetical protein
MPGTTPVYGFPYPEPTDLVADYPALGQQLAEDIEDVLPTLGGLIPVAPTSIANTGGSASTTSFTTTFTTVSSISLNGVFTSSYDNYRVLVKFTAASASAIYNMRMRASGADNTAASYNRQNILGQAASASASKATSQTTWLMGQNNSSTTYNFQIYDFYGPQRTEITTSMALIGELDAGDYIAKAQTLIHASTTAFDGLSMYPDSGTISGRIVVLAYRK